MQFAYGIAKLEMADTSAFAICTHIRACLITNTRYKHVGMALIKIAFVLSIRDIERTIRDNSKNKYAIASRIFEDLLVNACMA